MTRPLPHTPRRYLSRPQVAARLGLARGTLNRYRLPPPDATDETGRLRLWLPATIDRWDSQRPSKRKTEK